MNNMTTLNEMELNMVNGGNDVIVITDPDICILKPYIPSGKPLRKAGLCNTTFGPVLPILF